MKVVKNNNPEEILCKEEVLWLMEPKCSCGTILKGRIVNNWIIHWLDEYNEKIDFIFSCSSCHRVYTVQLKKWAKYGNHCWKCKKEVSSENNIRCAKCGYYICKNCGKCHENCDGKVMNIEDRFDFFHIKKTKQQQNIEPSQSEYGEQPESPDQDYDYVRDEMFCGDERAMNDWLKDS